MHKLRGGGPLVGEATRLAVVEKWPAFTCKLSTPGSRGDVTRRCCVVARHVNRENGGRTTHFGGQCAFPHIIRSRCNISVLRLFTVTFDYTKPPPRQLTVTWTRPRLGRLPHLVSFTWQNATPADRVTLPSRLGNPPRRVTLSCEHDQIKIRDYMGRRVTPPTWGPPPSCKQALRWLKCPQ